MIDFGEKINKQTTSVMYLFLLAEGMANFMRMDKDGRMEVNLHDPK